MIDGGMYFIYYLYWQTWRRLIMVQKIKSIGYCLGVYLLWEILGFAVQYLLLMLFPQMQEIWLGNYIFTIAADFVVFVICFLLLGRHLPSMKTGKARFLAIVLLPVYSSVTEYVWIIVAGQPAYQLISMDFVKMLLATAFAAAMIALCEEFIWRRVIFSKLLTTWKASDKGVYISVLLSAVMFGLCHYANMLTAGQDFQNTTIQVLNAICIGIFLGGLYYRTGHFSVPVLIHFISDFSNLFMNEFLDYTYDFA